MRLASALFAIAFLSACRTPSDPAAQLKDSDDYPEAKIRETHEVGVRELSGLALLPMANGDARLYAVGDHDPEVFEFELNDDFTKIESKEHDLGAQFGGDDGKQWEAIAVDASRRVFVLQEAPARIFVLDEALNGVDMTLKLDVSALPSSLHGGDNSLGEGLVLMKAGHVLIVKEKNPIVLIEFGPKNDQPLGANASTYLAAGEAFTLPNGGNAKLKPLKWWTIGDGSAEVVSDVSELAVGPDGALFVLSDESERIARLEGKLKVDEKHFAIKQAWQLPSEIKNPEGLVFVGDTPIVGSDRKNESKTMFVLDAIQ